MRKHVHRIKQLLKNLKFVDFIVPVKGYGNIQCFVIFNLLVADQRYESGYVERAKKINKNIEICAVQYSHNSQCHSGLNVLWAKGKKWRFTWNHRFDHFATRENKANKSYNNEHMTEHNLIQWILLNNSYLLYSPDYRISELLLLMPGYIGEYLNSS